MSIRKRYLNQDFIKENIENIYDLLVDSDALLSTDDLSKEVILMFNNNATEEEIIKFIKKKIAIPTEDESNRVLDFSFEPKLENRWSISLGDLKIPYYLFTKFSIKNVGNEFILKVNIIEVVGYTFNPNDLFNIDTIKIEDLSPTGDVCGGYIMDVVGSNMKIKMEYDSSELKTIKFRFVVNNFKTI